MKRVKRPDAADTSSDEASFRLLWSWLRANHPTLAASPDSDPVRNLERIKETFPSKFRSALREGLGDLVEWLQDLDGVSLAELDTFLTTQGAPSLTAMRLKRRSGIRRLLKRGSLVSDEEYRAVMSILNDVSETNPMAPDREALERLVSDYEQRSR
jgi:hypothetical protein